MTATAPPNFGPATSPVKETRTERRGPEELFRDMLDARRRGDAFAETVARCELTWYGVRATIDADAPCTRKGG